MHVNATSVEIGKISIRQNIIWKTVISRPAKIPKGLIFYFLGHVLFKAVTHVKLLHHDVLFKIGVDNIF